MLESVACHNGGEDGQDDRPCVHTYIHTYICIHTLIEKTPDTNMRSIHRCRSHCSTSPAALFASVTRFLLLSNSGSV
jgi:hypothetical protein